MNLKHCLCFLLILILTSQVKGQDRELTLFDLNYSFDKIKNDTINGHSNNINAFINAPLMYNDSTLLAMKLEFGGRYQGNLGDYFNYNVFQTDATFLWQKKMDEKNNFALIIKSGFYSDFQDISFKDIRYGIGSYYNIKHSQKFATGWGFFYNKQFTAHQITPLIFLKYNFHPKWELYGVFPVKPKLTYKFTDDLKWSIELDGKVDSYRLSEKEYDNSIFEHSVLFGLSSIDVLVKKHHKFSFSLGYTFRQDMKYYHDQAANNWKLFIFDVSENTQPVSYIKTKLFRSMIRYSFVL
ncbi:DUF6268 family outer membrane beta-barrel protein [Cyclobacterium marinum]|uniref:DUF6268 domain-containing protein n=1 Tax=Cyclobacterium marinum (strain ATCC 25205 / DSM 745 / LMG 13164 / NCIMB 1802) TaxID=880070 RepID=G0IUZ8_CYCMS|nr:DUF6268 family outer membrane beta-barrel protein [Cyclobacterium marinum]AEL26222.1 hypothetical protein Cycma_2481 [Cyclobacterium marinum DSM 745]